MSMVIEALAGTGKTFTLIEGIQHIDGTLSRGVVPSIQQKAIWEKFMEISQVDLICVTAFNVSIKNEIKAKLQNVPRCYVSTIHSIGLVTIKNQVGMTGEPVAVDKFKTYKLIEKLHGGLSITVLFRTKPGYPAAVRRLVQLSKYAMEECPTDNMLVGLAGQYDIALGNDPNLIFDSVRKVIELGRKDLTTVDFEDMIWLPITLDMPIKKYDLLLVDEAQDLNRCQQQLVLKAGQQIIVAGDRHQAIYGFAGADTESMNTLHDSLLRRAMNGNADYICNVLPLTISRRCSHAVVKEAQSIVPEFEVYPDNYQGSISIKDSCNDAIPRDMILCRTNAPLLSKAFKMANEGIAVEIIGKSISKNLIQLIKMLQPINIDDLSHKIAKYRERELERIKKAKYQSEAATIALRDKCACLQMFCRHNTSIERLVQDIEDLFSSGRKNAIRLSSIHQAKGLEARNVFIIRPDLLPHPLAKTSRQMEQEMNLKYVAITRAIENLIWVR